MKNEIHDAFEQVQAEQPLIDSTKRFLRQAREKKQAPMLRAPRLAAAMACLLFCFACAGGFLALQTPVSYISIDVNPSIELSLNRLNRVVSAQAWNDDGEVVLQGVKVSGMSYVQAIDAILDSDVMRPYLTDDAVLSFTVAADSEKTEQLLLDGIGQCSGCQKYRGQSYRADEALIQQAHQSGMSFGKYKAYQTLTAQGYDITPEQCQQMSMAEIRRLIRARGGETAGGGGGQRHRRRQKAEAGTPEP